MASTMKQKELKTRYPVTTGLEADSKHEGRKENLVPSEGSLVPKRMRKGID